MGTLKISKNFSSIPGPRLRKEGAFSAEQFRQEILLSAIKEAINNDEILTVDIDGTAGYGPSFLEESIGGLIRVEGIPYQTVIDHLKIKSDEEPYLIEDIMEYLKRDAQYVREHTV